MKAVYVIVALVLIIVAAGGGFYGGMAYAQGQSANNASSFLQQRASQTGQNGSTAQQTAQQGPCGFVGRGNFGGNGGTGGNGGFQGRQGQTGQGAQTGQNGQTGQGGNGFNAAQFGNCVARGTIKSVDAATGTMEISTAVNVVTVKVVNGTTNIVKTDVGSISDLKVGDRVTVFSKDSGDSPTASAVQLQNNPLGGQ